MFKSIAFPLSLPPDTFSAGRTYNFRLACSLVSYPAFIAFTEIVIPVDAPPTGGFVTVTPSNGYALSTLFLMSTTGWTADASSLPLGYIFAYQLSIIKGALVLNVQGPKPYVSSPLPPGLPTMNNILTVFAVAVDIYGGTANASAPVTTVISPTEDPSTYLKSLLGKSLSSGNLDQTFSTINLVSSTISIVNCTASPNCTALQRSNCYATVNTCGSCLPGHLGVVGDSNAKCFSAASNSGGEGAPCFTNSTCLYGHCVDHKCATPNKQCQSSSRYTICSGNGDCHFTDASGNILKQCLITSPFCTAACQCRTGYGGVDCSFDTTALLRRENARVSMCTALLSVIAVSPKSAHLFDSIVAALESAYDYTEITTISGRATCSRVLRFLGVMATKGYLGTSLPVSQQTFADITSQFVKSTVSNPKQNGRRQLTLADQFATNIAQAVAGLTTGTGQCAANNTHCYLRAPYVLQRLFYNCSPPSSPCALSRSVGTVKSMVPGQTPVSLVSDNVRVTATHDLVSSLKNANLSPPKTAAEVVQSFYHYMQV